MVQGLQYLDLHLLRSNMLFQIIQKKEILQQVKKAIFLARREILATMFLKEELRNPLPISYFNLLRKKINEGILLKRLGFGTKEDYNRIKDRNKIESNNYEFRCIIQESKYQRLIVIDRKKLFFGVDGLYFASTHMPFIEVFVNYFNYNFKKGK